jgi:GT2 family glycosyltransferase
MSQPLTLPKLPWTGERMVPFESDPTTQLHHWQRYLYFRPWYEDVKVTDAACGEGYGTNYASVFATSAKGVDISSEATEHATKRYPGATFKTGDVCTADYSDADLVVSFETIEHLSDPSAFLKALAACKGRIVISTPNRALVSPGNKQTDKPFNQFHTIEWTPAEFAEFVTNHFPDRQVRFLSQEAKWPGLIREGLDDSALFTIAVIGDGELPNWPAIGMAIPTHNNWNQLQDAIRTLSSTYPGEMRFAVVANGCDDENMKPLRAMQADIPNMVHVIEEDTNRGYGVGMNIALDFLRREERYDLFGVINDDVIPHTDCVSELVSSLSRLKAAGHNPGAIGPVSNSITGQQQVEIGGFTDYPTLMYRAEQYHREYHSTVSQVLQVRGLFLLITPECLEAVGGFDPRFGLGNFEDDDHNLRCTLSGFSLWIDNGAFLYHHGSSTFKRLNIDYQANIARNMDRMMKKWDLAQIEDWVGLRGAPAGVNLHVPLGRPVEHEIKFEVTINGEKLDLINEASSLEFAGWVMHRINSKPASIRKALIELIERTKLSA